MGSGGGAAVSGASTLAAALLIAAGVAAAVSALSTRMVLERVPRIASVRLAELTAEYVTQAARERKGGDEAAEAARDWAGRLDEALGRISAHYRVVLLPARAVAAGAEDFTDRVKATMRAAAREDDVPASLEAKR